MWPSSMPQSEKDAATVECYLEPSHKIPLEFKKLLFSAIIISLK